MAPSEAIPEGRERGNRRARRVVFLFVGSLLGSCAMPPLSDVIDGLPCALGECATGYVCEPVTNRCLLPSELGDASVSGTGGGSSGGTSGGTGGESAGGAGPGGSGGVGGVAAGGQGGSSGAGGEVLRDASVDAGTGGSGAHDASSDAGSFCHDGILDHDETDTDCGGPVCAPCQVGQSCLAAIDCKSQVCGASDGGRRVCATPCSDGFMDGTETDTDCGGTECSPCSIGGACLLDTDCTSDNCLSGVCAVVSCFDQKRDGTESDTDCGGTSSPACKLCLVGKHCNVSTDCLSAVCGPASTCLTPTCTDGVKNSAETDKDCGGGGGCPKCKLTQACIKSSDCLSGFCSNKVCSS